MGCTDWFALAAAQTIFDTIRDRANIALLQDQGLMPHQPKGWRIGITQICIRQQLALVETALGVNTLFIVTKLGDLVVGQEL